MACLQRFEPLFNRLGEAEPITHLVHSSQHQRLLELIFVEALASSHENAHYAFSGGIGKTLLDDSSVPWLLTKYRDAHHPLERKLIAHCIGGCLSFQSSPILLDEVIGAACDDALQAESPLADEISFLVKPYWLDDKNTQYIREGYINRQKGKQGLNPPPAQRVENALIEFESGKQDVWMRLWRELNLEDDAVSYSWSLKEICDMPGWNRLDIRGKKRVQQCAIGWLNSQKLTDADLFLKNIYSDKHISFSLAFDLLMRQDQAALKKFPVERWQEWAPAIVRYPHSTKVRASLLRLAYALAPESTLATFRRECEREMAGDGPLSLHDLKTLWDVNIAALLRELLKYDELKPQHRQELLESLMAQGDHAALDTAFGLFAVASDEEALGFASLLLNHAAAKAWPILWKKMGEDTTFAREFMLRAASRGHSFAFLNKLDESQLAKLYVLLETHFPQAEDIQHPEGVAYSPTSRDDVANLRGNSITQLAGRGTQAAIMELLAICGQFPNHDWLWHQLAQAREKMRQLAWQPIPPRELLDFLQRADTRLVRNATELAEAVIASLSRLQAKFKGESPLAPFLWNMDEDKKLGWPKGEDRMSDFVLHHLRADLPMLVINREVQVQNLNESGVPERADLKVETLDAEGNPLTLIVESKGCWNAKLHTEMATQLHDRYMEKTHAGAGIYLVGWFACERWKDEMKKTACQKQVSLEHLREILSRQAEKFAGVRVFVLDATY